MEGFTLVDGVVLFVLVLSALLAYSRGFMREVLSIVGWVVAAVAGFVFAPDVNPLIAEIPFVSDVIGTNCELSIIASFGLVFVAALVVVSIFTPLISGAIQNSALGPVDQGLGFLFGLARGALLVVIALIVYDRLIAGGEGIPMVEDSRTVEILAQTQTRLAEQIPQDAPAWIAARYSELTSVCTGEAAAPEAAPAPETAPEAPAGQ
ncbi:CvpA family protein [Halovulum dunhuangense]|uniref:CvpA family protein n=1 Tax=Halovulum dunhuangense TaxID=1505036 RepID=A0A849L6W8_9RHOB|nr:CvpA family protein [Halovulum dunhuangense]NNU81882.1 CvpA family protein [Halovulum dunhuangense]